MNNNNQLLNFLIELFQRLRTKKPKFFVYLQWITGALGAITGLPSFLAQFNITLPPAATAMENKYVAWATIGFLIASQLTSASKTQTVTADGAVLKQTDQKKLPFTAKAEVKKAQVDEVPNASVTLADIKTVK